VYSLEDAMIIIESIEVPKINEYYAVEAAKNNTKKGKLR
jgi:hypothetical protein